MREGSLEAPTRHAIDWQNPDFYDRGKIDAEMRRVFDICHGCRRCFNLCDSFPRLFDLIDATPDGAVAEVRSEQFKPVVYPRCCGMPQLEHGELAKVAENARAVAREMSPLIDQGSDIVALVPSCALM